MGRKISLAPIVLFVYNRPWHTQKVLEALKKNELASESELYIYSDQGKNEDAREGVGEVRAYIEKIDGFKKVTIIKRKKNWGLADSIIDGVSTLVNEYGKIIVLEDDLVTSAYFLQFMNDALFMYKNEPKVASIHGYIYPIDNLPNTFFIKGADCWGWATWKDKWDIFEPNGQKLFNELKSRKLEREADFNNSYGFTKMLKQQIKGKNNSWAIRWYMSAFLKDMLTLHPGKSYIQNIGNDNSGTHCGVTEQFKIELSNSNSNSRVNIIEDFNSRGKIECFFNSIKLTPVQKVKVLIKKVMF
jgi:hypothetical protein